jgi:hypothetical protein
VSPVWAAFACGVLLVLATEMQDGAARLAGGIERLLAVRRSLLTAPAGAIDAVCASEAPRGCRLGLAWRTEDAWVSVCEAPPQDEGDPRLRPRRHYALTLTCTMARWTLPPLAVRLAR